MVGKRARLGDVPSMLEYAARCRHLALVMRHPLMRERLLQLVRALEQEAARFERRSARGKSDND